MKGDWDRELDAIGFDLMREDGSLPPDTSELPPPLGISNERPEPPRDADLRDRLFSALPDGMISNSAREFYYGSKALNDKQLRAAFVVADASEKPHATYACKVYEACLGELMSTRRRHRDAETAPAEPDEMTPLAQVVCGPLAPEEEQALIDGTKQTLGGQGVTRGKASAPVPSRTRPAPPADPALLLLISKGVPCDLALSISRRQSVEWVEEVLSPLAAAGLQGRALGHAVCREAMR